MMGKMWEQMSTEERQEARFQTWLDGKGIQFVSPAAKAAYQAKITRLKDAIQLKKVPDRVPVFPFYTFMPVTLYNVTPGEVMYDGAKLASVWKRYLQDYEPDYYVSPGLVMHGPLLEKIGYKLYKWPGHNISEKYPYQCVEAEYMKPEDYDALIDDPSDFWSRTYLPRICDVLAPLQNLPPVTMLMELPFMAPYLISLGVPEVQNALKTLTEVGQLAFQWAGHIGGFEMEAQAQGFVNGIGGVTKAPYDVLGDTLRGTQPIMMDIYRNPDKLLKALERLTPLMIKLGVSGPVQSGNPIVFIPLHKGADGFMSDGQFQTFYWPFLKQVILGLIQEGCVPLLFAEGGYNTRLEYLKDLPKGHCIWMFDRTDMAKAKEVIGGTTCIAGNIPVSKILSGTPQQIKEICKQLIDVAGKNGGYIMTCGCSMDEGKPDTLHAMIDFTKEYGVYKKK
jgi:hypothetical protein